MKPTSYIEAKQIPQERIDSMARPVLAAVRKAFEDPDTAKDYERWLAKRAATTSASKSTRDTPG